MRSPLWQSSYSRVQSAGHGERPEVAAQPNTTKAIMFAADGMRPDLMERYARKGLMPTYRD